MKPVRLTMQAFGPYAAREVVDFRPAVANGLFGIYGPTGAGKSTIFSAMTFALFGEAARAEQDTTSLRSDLADAALPTEVELVFDLAGRRYVVRRRPEQTRPKQRGSGETRDPHEASLFDATGLAVEAITETHCGKALAERKTGLVRAAVNDLLGYGAEQFRQIVLLPQGRFEAFLAARTDERLKILRDLFDVSLYRQLMQKLKTDADAAERQVRDERLVYGRRLEAAGFETVEALGAAIEAAAEGLRDAREREEAAGNAAAIALSARESAERIAERFDAAAAAQSALQALEARAEEIAAVACRLDGARRAEALRDVENHAAEAAGDAREAEKARADAEAAALAAAGRMEEAAAALAAAREDAPELESRVAEVQALEVHRRTLAGAADFAVTATAARNALSVARDGWERAAADHARLAAELAAAEDALAAARADAAARQQVVARRAELDASLKSAAAYGRTRKAAFEAETEAEAKTAADRDAEHALCEAQSALAAVEAEVAAAQALKLAAGLRPDEPCPVCGSHSHPAPASGSPKHAGLNRRFDIARAAFKAADGARSQSATALAGALATRDAWRERLAELALPDGDEAALAAAFAVVGRELEALGPLRDPDAAEARWRSVKADLARAESAREHRRATHDAARETSLGADVRLDQALSVVPNGLRDAGALAAAHSTAEAALGTLRASRAAAEAEERSAREALIGARKDAGAAIGTLAAAEARRTSAEARFAARLAEGGFSRDDYAAHKLAIATIAADQASVDGHARALASARADAARTAAAVAGQERPDLAAIRESVGAAEAELRASTEARVRAESEHARLRALRQSLQDTSRDIIAYEMRTAPLRGLSALFNAQNPHKLDLETFAIGAMFEEVLRAANLRLGPMTAGRYTLEREVEVGSGRSRSGLGIRVFDIHTGKSRPTATLSGGETFIAALALALGLSDVVESASGKVRLDTIFIDEGFGSLDAENESGTLEQVLGVLTDLAGRSRAIGLISHVPMVQEAIPNGFYIRQNAARGSRVEVRGLG